MRIHENNSLDGISKKSTQLDHLRLLVHYWLEGTSIWPLEKFANEIIILQFLN